MTLDQPFADGRLLLRRDGPIATLVLNQPGKRNAISAAMWRAFPEVANLVSGEPSIRVVLVRGTGDDAFSAGADIGEFEDVYSDGDRANAYNDATRAGQAALRHIAQPVIAVIHGVCVGGGCGLALACDLRFAAAGARFGITPAKLGLAYSWQDTAQLVEKVGPARAKDILFSGRLLDAREALAIGLIDRVLDGEALEAEALAYAQTLAGLSQSSIRAAKVIVNRIVERDGDVPEAAAKPYRDSFSSKDFREGYRAFVEKRKPRFE